MDFLGLKTSFGVPDFWVSAFFGLGFCGCGSFWVLRRVLIWGFRLLGFRTFGTRLWGFLASGVWGFRIWGGSRVLGFRLLALLIFGLSPGLLRLQLLSVASFLSVPKGVELRMQKGTMGSLYRGSL